MKIVQITLAATLLSAIASTAMAVPTGFVSEDYLSMNGSLSGVTLNVEGRLLSTGDISFILNPAARSYVGYNFDNNTALTHLQLLLTSPLQAQIGTPTIPMTIDESGPITAITSAPINPAGDHSHPQVASFQGFITQPNGPPLATTGSLVATSGHNPLLDPYLIRFVTSGGGIVPPTGSGSLFPFAGISFQNDNKWQVIVGCETVTINNVQQCATPESQVPTQTGPEPSTFLLFSLGSGLLGLVWWRRKQEIRKATN